MNIKFTLVFSWNKPVHELIVPIAYASSEGSDEPAHPRKIVSALTANCRHTHRRYIPQFRVIAPLGAYEFENMQDLEMITTSLNSLYLPYASRLSIFSV